MKQGDAIRLDADPATVTDRIKVTEGSGEDAESWWLTRVRVDATGDEYLLEDYKQEHTLYHAADPAADGERPRLHAKDHALVACKGETLSGRVEYEEGTIDGGDSYLRLDDDLWLEEDVALRYGPGDNWLARGTTPARLLARYPVEAPRREGPVDVAVDLVPAAVVAAWCLLDTFVADLAFRSLFWIPGILALIWAWLPGRVRFYRAARIVGFGFSMWVLTAVLYNLMATPGATASDAARAELAVDVRALFFLLAAWPPFLLHRRTFYVVCDAATNAAATSLVAYTAGHLLFGFIAEDFDYLPDWLWYLGAFPWGWIWPLVFVGFLLYRWADYAKVPLDSAGFTELKRTLAETLERPDFLAHCKALGDAADDLRDATRIATDPDVVAYTGHGDELARVALAFRKLATAGADTLAESSGPRLDQAREDAALLASELRALDPSGESLRISPLLRSISEAGDKPHEAWVHKLLL